MLAMPTRPSFGGWNRRVLSARCILCCLLFAFSSGLSAALPALSLADAVQRSLAQNPRLKVFPFRAAALQGQAETAKLRPAYELGVDAENLGGSGEFAGVDGAELTVALSSVIEMGDKRAARQGLVSNSYAVLEATRQVESLALLGEVTRRYVAVLTAQKKVALAAEDVELAEESLAVVAKRAKAGATPEVEVKRAEAASAQAKLSLLAEQQHFAYLKMALAALWASTTPDFNAVQGDLFQFGADVGFESLYTKLEKNPAIEVFAAESRLKEAELRLARTEARADISWSFGVRQFQANSDTALLAGFSVPLFSGKRNSGAIKTAYAEKNQILIQREAALLELHTQLYRAFYSRQQAIVAVKTLGITIIPALEQALSATQTAYEGGRYGYLDYVSARQELLAARRGRIEAAAAALQYGAEIEQLTGQSLSAQALRANHRAEAHDDRANTYSGTFQ